MSVPLYFLFAFVHTGGMRNANYGGERKPLKKVHFEAHGRSLELSRVESVEPTQTVHTFTLKQAARTGWPL